MQCTAKKASATTRYNDNRKRPVYGPLRPPPVFSTGWACSGFPWVFTPRSLIRLSLGFIDYSNVRKDDPTPARRHRAKDVPTTLAQALWAQDAEARYPRINGPELTGEPRIETYRRGVALFPRRYLSARRKRRREDIVHVHRLLGTDGRPHPRTVDQRAGGNQYHVNLYNDVNLSSAAMRPS